MLKSFFKKWSFLFKIRLFYGIFLFVILGLFLFFKIVPFGHITYIRSYSDSFKLGKGFVYNFSPPERVDTSRGSYPRVIGDPLYFSVFTPRTFDKVKLTIKYKDHLSNKEPIVEAGVLVDNIVWRYDLKPLQNKIVDSLKKDWPRLENGSKVLLQRDGSYSSWTDMEADLAKGQLKNCPGGINSCLATYNYNIIPHYQETNYNSKPLVIDTPLRGGHQIYIYLSNSSLHLKFDFINIYSNTKDPIQVDLYSMDDNKLLSSKYLAGSQTRDANKATSTLELKTIIINEKNLVNGLYKVDIKIKDDTIVKRIESSANKLVFVNKIWPVSAILPLSLWTDALYVQAKVYSPASRQTLNFGGRDFVLDRPYEQYDLLAANKSNSQEIKLVKDDVILENNGVFSLTYESLFNPNPKKIDRFFALNDDIKYILTEYEAPLDYVESGYKTKSIELNLKAAYRESNKYSFMISVPGLKANSSSSVSTTSKDYLEIKEIKLDLSGRSLWQKIFNKSF